MLRESSFKIKAGITDKIVFLDDINEKLYQRLRCCSIAVSPEDKVLAIDIETALDFGY